MRLRLHVGYSTQRLASLPSDHRALAARCLRGDDTAEVWDVGDGAICALACLRAGGESAVAWCTPGDALHAAHVARRFEVSLWIFSPSECGARDRRRSCCLTGEPYYHDLEGHPVAGALRFWRRCSMLRELFSGRRVRVAPGRAVGGCRRDPVRRPEERTGRCRTKSAGFIKTRRPRRGARRGGSSFPLI